MPSLAALERAVVMLNERFPACRVAWGWDESRRHWTLPTGATAADGIVVDGGHVDVTSIGVTLDRINGDPSLRQPLALIRFDDYLGLRMSHAIGDGRTFNEVFAAVLHTAITGELYPWQLGPSHRFPLGAAILRTFGRHPGLVREALSDKPTRGDAPPGDAVAWMPARRTLAAVIPAEDRDELIDEARREHPNSSWLGVVISRLLGALSASGVRVALDVSVVMDLRRYLSNPLLDGNFVAGVPLSIDHRNGPGDVTRTLNRTVASGRPLATQVMATRSIRSGGADRWFVDPAAPVRVTFSAMGRPPQIDALPFLADRPAIYAGGVEPDGPCGLTFLVSETSRTTVVSASFHDNVLPADAVRQALSALAGAGDCHVSDKAVTSWCG
jgi:hypothetical protein